MDNTPFTPNYGTNMLDEVTLVAEKEKKPFEETFVGKLLGNFSTGLGQTIGQQQQQQQIGTPSIQPLSTPSSNLPRPTVSSKVSSSVKPKNTGMQTTLIVVGSVVVLGAVGYLAYRNSKNKEPLSDQGSKKKRSPKSVNL